MTMSRAIAFGHRVHELLKNARLYVSCYKAILPRGAGNRSRRLLATIQNSWLQFKCDGPEQANLNKSVPQLFDNIR